MCTTPIYFKFDKLNYNLQIAKSKESAIEFKMLTCLKVSLIHSIREGTLLANVVGRVAYLIAGCQINS